MEIKLPYDNAEAVEDGKQFALDVVGLTLEIARVADAAGNKMKEFKFDVLSIDPAGNVSIDKVELTAEDTVVVTFKDKLTTFKTTDFYRKSGSTIESALKYTSGDAIEIASGDAIEIASGDAIEIASGDAIKIARIRHSVNKDGNSEVTLVLDEEFKTTVIAGDGWKFQILVNEEGKAESANTYGETIEHDRAVDVDDKAAPVVEEVYYVTTNDSIIVVFSEEIDPSTVLSSRAVKGFKVSGNKAELESAVLNASDITLKVGDDTVEIGKNKAVVLTGKNFNKYTDVSYDDAFGMADKSGNAVKSFSWTKTLKVADE